MLAYANLPVLHPGVTPDGAGRLVPDGTGMWGEWCGGGEGPFFGRRENRMRRKSDRGGGWIGRDLACHILTPFLALLASHQASHQASQICIAGADLRTL